MAGYAAIGVLVCLVLASVLSGCVDGEPQFELTEEEAPFGPDSLRVGSWRTGDYMRVESNVNGTIVATYRVNDEPPTTKIEPYVDHDYRETWIEPVADSRDRFLQQRTIVPHKYRNTDVDPTEHQRAITEGHSAIDLATGSQLWSETESVFDALRYECTLLGIAGCSTTEEQRVRPIRLYRNDVTDAFWGELSGQVLIRGEPLSFNRTVDVGDYAGIAWLNYTVVGVEVVDGERAFVVEPSYDFEYTRRPEPALTPTPEPEEKEEEEDELPPLPEPVNRIWVTAKSPVPVRTVTSSAFRHEGQTLWWNSTSALVNFTRGETVVPWGEAEAPPPLDVLPGATLVPADAMFDPTASDAGLSYELADAWANVRADVTLTEFQEFLSTHPDAWPFASEYHPDPDNGAYTWNFYVGDGSGDVIFVASRWQSLERWGDSSVGAHQNEEEVDPIGFLRAPPRDLLDDLQLVDLASAVQAYDAWRPGEPEPLIGINLGVWEFDSEPFWSFQPTVDFYQAETWSDSGPLFGGTEFWVASDTASFLLADGGLRGLNLTFGVVLYEWPWTTVPSSPAPAGAHPGHADPWSLAPAQPGHQPGWPAWMP